MAIFFTSDLHLGHRAIITFCDRPFMTTEDMNTSLVLNWNKVVKPEDRVYVLGDFSFCNAKVTEEYLKRLNGEKYLIKGNHDKFTNTKLREMGFAFVAVNLLLELRGLEHPLLLSHYPYTTVVNYTAEFTKEMDRYRDKRPVPKGLWLLSGHTHSKERIDRPNKMIHVGVDAWNYTPIHEQDIVKLIKGDESV